MQPGQADHRPRRLNVKLSGVVQTVVEIATVVVLSTPGMVLFLAVTVYLLGAIRRILLGRGWLPRLTTMFATTFPLMMVLATVLMAIAMTRIDTISSPVLLPLVMIVPTVVAGALMALVCALLPRRRATGPNWRCNGLLARALAGLRHLNGAGLRGRSRRHDRSHLSPTGSDLVQRDRADRGRGLPRRGIRHDRRCLKVDGPGGGASARLRLHTADGIGDHRPGPVPAAVPRGAAAVPLLAHRDRRDNRGVLGATVAARLGTLVALGNPNDRMVPVGALRLYRDAETWRPTLLDLIDRSTRIIAVSSDAGHTEWELEQVRQRGGLRKLFILTPPALEQRRPAANSPAGSDRVGAILAFVTKALFFASITRARTTSDYNEQAFGDDWDETVTALRNAGFRMRSSTPGLGAVIAFDETAESVIVGSAFNQPQQHVDAIHVRLDPGATGVLPWR